MPSVTQNSVGHVVSDSDEHEELARLNADLRSVLLDSFTEEEANMFYGGHWFYKGAEDFVLDGRGTAKDSQIRRVVGVTKRIEGVLYGAAVAEMMDRTLHVTDKGPVADGKMTFHPLPNVVEEAEAKSNERRSKKTA